MRKAIVTAGLSTLLLLSVCQAFAAAPSTPKGNSGAIVIVFKDGHRQTFNMADIDRIEFPGSATASADTQPYNPAWPPRGRYFGKWEAGDGNGGTFTITLRESGEAFRSIGDVHGHWVYINGEAHISWNDGAMDALRKVGKRFEKSAYSAGKSFSDTPDNVTDAHNTARGPI